MRAKSIDSPRSPPDDRSKAIATRYAVLLVAVASAITSACAPTLRELAKQCRETGECAWVDKACPASGPAHVPFSRGDRPDTFRDSEWCYLIANAGIVRDKYSPRSSVTLDKATELISRGCLLDGDFGVCAAACENGSSENISRSAEVLDSWCRKAALLPIADQHVDVERFDRIRKRMVKPLVANTLTRNDRSESSYRAGFIFRGGELIAAAGADLSLGSNVEFHEGLNNTNDRNVKAVESRWLSAVSAPTAQDALKRFHEAEQVANGQWDFITSRELRLYADIERRWGDADKAAVLYGVACNQDVGSERACAEAASLGKASVDSAQRQIDRLRDTRAAEKQLRDEERMERQREREEESAARERAYQRDMATIQAAGNMKSDGRTGAQSTAADSPLPRPKAAPQDMGPSRGLDPVQAKQQSELMACERARGKCQDECSANQPRWDAKWLDACRAKCLRCHGEDDAFVPSTGAR